MYGNFWQSKRGCAGGLRAIMDMQTSLLVGLYLFLTLQVGFVLAILIAIKDILNTCETIETNIDQLTDSIEKRIPNRFITFNGTAGKLYRKE